MGKIIAVANQKGGVGKTTTCINLSAALGALEKNVLLIDSDPQANVSLGLGLEDSKIGYYQFLSGFSIKECVNTTTSQYFDVMTANIELASLELTNTKKTSYYLMKEKLNVIKHLYDYIIIDCPPSVGFILINILTACDSIIIPVQCEYFAFHGLKKIFLTIKTIKKEINPEIDIEGILITMYNKSIGEHKFILNSINEHFQILMFKTIIPQNIKLAEASNAGKNIIEYNANSNGAIHYLKLADELITNNTSESNSTNVSLMTTSNAFLVNHNEDVIEDLDFILNINKTKKTKKQNYSYIVGLSKEEIKNRLGQLFNDMNSDVWRYKISEDFSFFKKNYLYIYFSKNIAVSYSLERFKLPD